MEDEMERGYRNVSMDERMEVEESLGLALGQPKIQISLSGLLLIILQFNATGDEGQLIEDFEYLGVRVKR
ncbi:MAG: hypothetical protein Q8M92_01140 [Candidatus Subteraquimicrobiales bacterium]|nr:hypothetical protein [Candidatus Subteraquimicrobiales bacterium]